VATFGFQKGRDIDALGNNRSNMFPQNVLGREIQSLKMAILNRQAEKNFSS